MSDEVQITGSLVEDISAPPRVPYSLPDIREAEILEVVDSLRSGWLTTGNKTRRFESAFAEFIGCETQAIAVNSCTAGLHLVLEALGIGPDDEVIVPVFTFTASAEVVRYLGAHPVFVDCHPETLNIDPRHIEAAITCKTKAIIVVHYAGLPCEMDTILEIARRHRIHVVEDAAHALPSSVNGKKIGALDTAATVFSFYATKTLTTGEGGMICSRSATLIERCKVMRLHGIDRDAFDRYRSRNASWYYEIVAPGFKYNLTDIASSIGIHQLRRVEEMAARRKQIAETYTAAFRDLPLILPAEGPAGVDHSWYAYAIRLRGGGRQRRDEVIRSLLGRGIGCTVQFIPLHLQPYWRTTYNLRDDQFPAAEEAYSGLINIPIYSKLTDHAQEEVITAVSQLVSQ